MDPLEEPWGLLVVKEGGEDERIPVIGHEFVIGRAKGMKTMHKGGDWWGFVNTLGFST